MIETIFNVWSMVGLLFWMLTWCHADRDFPKRQLTKTGEYVIHFLGGPVIWFIGGFFFSVNFIMNKATIKLPKRFYKDEE